MKILLSSHLFPPSIGGLEQVSALLAESFVQTGHEVRVVTQSTPEAAVPDPVVRRPNPLALLNHVRWCDVLFHNNISLRTAWPLLLCRRPWVVAHHIWIRRADGSRRWPEKLKLRLLRYAHNIAISPAIANELPVPAEIIPDPYPADLFRTIPGLPRDRDLVFLGRLVSDKGVDLLITALAKLRSQQIKPTVTIIGDGPERSRLKTQTAQLGLTGQIRFLGSQTGSALVELLNQHRLLVVPSRWQEPFGIVALEGIACGCAVVGSDQGGLPEAIGPCGVTFPNGNITALAKTLADLLAQPERQARLRVEAQNHLRKHHPLVVAQAYLSVLERACQAATANGRQAMVGTEARLAKPIADPRSAR